MFNFKQFSVDDDKCAMKVGMDSVLLGAWANVVDAKRVLDIGAGCGILSLMVAQRNATAEIVGIEISKYAVVNAKSNFEVTSWRDRLSIVCGDISCYNSPNKFDCIISNPPYFNDNPTNMGNERRISRHTKTLPFEMLLNSVVRLMSDDGCFSLILPIESYANFSNAAAMCELFEHRKLYVLPKVNKEPNRVLLEYRKSMVEMADVGTLSLRAAHGSYSREYESLTSGFYLRDI